MARGDGSAQDLGAHTYEISTRWVKSHPICRVKSPANARCSWIPYREFRRKCLWLRPCFARSLDVGFRDRASEPGQCGKLARHETIPLEELAEIPALLTGGLGRSAHVTLMLGEEP